MKRVLLTGIPLFIFAIITVFLWRGLSMDPRKIPSALLDKPSPEFTLSTLKGKQKTFSRGDLIGHISLVNVWASWCLTCRDEHELLMQIAQSKTVTLYGLNYKDEKSDALKWINKFGNPYQVIGTDVKGDVAIDWGVYGTPETFLVDKKGFIRYKYVGAMTEEVWKTKLLPIIKTLKKANV